MVGIRCMTLQVENYSQFATVKVLETIGKHPFGVYLTGHFVPPNVAFFTLFTPDNHEPLETQDFEALIRSLARTIAEHRP